MKLKDYMQYLKIMHDRYGDDIEVKEETIDVIGDFVLNDKTTNAPKPYYNKDNNCIIVHKEFKNYGMK